MAAVALDLTPIVDGLLERPFDRKALEAANLAVGGHAHAYATALRCAAKRAEDKTVAAHFLVEAAHVHESVDDLGGAIALLFRALECDHADSRTSELLAACMTRLAVRAGLPFTFSPGADAPTPRADERRAPLRESGFRPARRDTLPDLFGLDSHQAGPELEGDTLDSSSSESTPDTIASAPAPAPTPALQLDSNPVVFALESSRRVEPMLPPRDPEAPVSMPLPPPTEHEPVLRAIADLTMAPRRTVLIPPDPAAPPPPSAVTRRSSDLPRSSEFPASDDIYGEPKAAESVRPSGEQLVGELFEAVHGLHFSEDVRGGATYLARVLADRMPASTILVHVYDINSRHFVVMSAVSERAAALADYATPEDDPFVVELMKEEEAMLVIDPKDDPRLARGRWLLAEPKRSVLCAPAVLDGRYLGLIEMADPVDGSEFTEEDRNALTYVATAFSQFLDKRGIVLSESEEAG
jgi:hypothetical protein